jgi:shikimate kinase
VVLIGLPGAGKTTVAQRAAALLDAPWTDLDERIAAAAGCSIPEIFSTRGEPAFRAMERAAMRDALDQPPQIIAAGGGWAAEPGNVAETELRALLIYLSIEPADALRRLGGASDRPLLAGGDPLAALDALLARRESWYRLAAIEVAVGQATPDNAAAAVVTAARQYGGW